VGRGAGVSEAAGMGVGGAVVGAGEEAGVPHPVNAMLAITTLKRNRK